MKKGFLVLLTAAAMVFSFAARAETAEAGAFRLDHFQGGAMGIEMIDVPVDEGAEIMSLWPNQKVTDVKLEKIETDCGRIEDVTVLYEADLLESNQVLNIAAFEPEIFPTLRVRCVNEAGEEECWYLGASGEDDSLLLLSREEAGIREANEFSFMDVSDLEFTFSSGVGAWYTVLNMEADGAFSGHFQDSNMGETGEGYPGGTVYGSLFHGRFEIAEQVDETTYKLKMVLLEEDEGAVSDYIEDGILYVTADPYGLTGTDEFILYLPGTPMENIPEGYLMWAHLYDEIPEELPFYGLYNEKEECGFVGEEPFWEDDWEIIE